MVIFKLRKLNGKRENMNSYDLLRSLPASRFHPRTLHMHMHMHTPFYKNVRDVQLYLNDCRSHRSKHKALESTLL